MRIGYALLAICLSWPSPLELSAQAPGGDNQIIINRNGAYGSALVVTDATGSNLTAPGLTQALNIPNACVSVDSQGAVGDGTTQDGPAFRAAVNAAKANGTNAICLSKGKRYLVSDTAGTIMLPGDNGKCTQYATGCTDLAPEPVHMQAYTMVIPSNFKIYGNGAQVIGPWSNGRPLSIDLNTPYTLVCSDSTGNGPDGIQPAFAGPPSYVLTYGNCINVVIENLNFERAFVAMFSPGLLAGSTFDHLTFGTNGILMLSHYSDRNQYTFWQDNNSYTGRVNGGWWVHRCCVDDSHPDANDIGTGGYEDLPVANRLVLTQLGDPTVLASSLDTYFDNYFYKSANSSNGRALQQVPVNHYHGIYGDGWASYARYLRPNNNGILANITCEGQSRECILIDATWNQAQINSVAVEGNGFCHGALGGGDPYGSIVTGHQCPDPLGFAGGISPTGVIPAPIIFLSAQTTGSAMAAALQAQNGAAVNLPNYLGNIAAVTSRPGWATVTGSLNVINNSEPGNNGVWRSGQGGGQTNVSYPSSRLMIYGSGIGQNGTNYDDGYVLQSFPPSVGNGDDYLDFVPSPDPQLALHAFGIKIPGLKLCPTVPTTFNTELAGCNAIALKGVTGTGTSIVSSTDPTITTSSGGNGTNWNDHLGNNIGRFADSGIFFAGSNLNTAISNSSGASLITARTGSMFTDTGGAFSNVMRVQGSEVIKAFPSKGAAIGAGAADPGANNLNVQGVYKVSGVSGFTGTKTVGPCVFTISGGIITNVTSC
jgi:hypothetical protein